MQIARLLLAAMAVAGAAVAADSAVAQAAARMEQKGERSRRRGWRWNLARAGVDRLEQN